MLNQVSLSQGGPWEPCGLTKTIIWPWLLLGYLYLVTYSLRTCVFSWATKTMSPVGQSWGRIKREQIGLPWWLGGKESACQCRGHEFDLWSRKIPHAAEQLSPSTITTEPVLQSSRTATTEPMCSNSWNLCALEPMLRNKRSPCNEKPVHNNEE